MGYLIYDLILLAVLAIFVCLGWKKGLLLSLCGLVVVIAAYLGAGFLADTLDEPVAAVVAPKLEQAIQESLALHYDDSGIKEPLDALRGMGGLFGWAADSVEDAHDAAVADSLDALAGRAAHLMALKVTHTVLFSLAFLLLFILLTILLHALDLVAKLPGLSFCNGLGGGVIGLLKGCLIVLVAVSCLRLFSSVIPPEAEEKTFLLRFFLRFDQLLPLFGG